MVEAAYHYINSQGLDALSLRRLAESINVTAPALYAHITGKQDLLAAVAEIGFAELIARFDGIATADPGEQLRLMARAYVEHALNQPEMFRVMFRFRPDTLEVPDADNISTLATTAMNRSMESVVIAQAAGLVHPQRDASMAALTLWTATHGCASVMLLGSADGKSRNIPEFHGLLDEVLGATLAGLAMEPPH